MTSLDDLAIVAPTSASSSVPIAPSSPSTPYQAEQPQSRGDRSHTSLEIHVVQDVLAMKGAGSDVEPATLSGNLVLHLAEPTSIKEINLVFRGKARIPAHFTESMSLNGSSHTYVVCSHDWSFLEGTKSHSHTLKAGRHVFPFSMQLGGSLPSTIFSPPFGGASVHYKLRATAVRPGLAHNLSTSIPLTVLRTLAPESLEYQQTLEIESIWPDKLMYSLSLPHKAWAIGDKLSMLAKFEPLTKGVRVKSVTGTLVETTNITGRGGHGHENVRIVMTAEHDIAGGKAILVEQYGQYRRYTPPSSTSESSYNVPNSALSTTTLAAASTSAQGSGAETPSLAIDLPEDLEPAEDEVVTVLTLPLLPNVGITPTHTLKPVQVTHRVEWSILLSNLDGHTSQLCCSQPVHILDARLLSDARAATRLTRALLLGDDPAALGFSQHGEVADEEALDAELPSYIAHLRDRVANAFVPDAATVRVGIRSGAWTPAEVGSSGWHTPGNKENVVSGHLPAHPSHGDGHDGYTPLEYVNSELMMLSGPASADPNERTVDAHPHSRGGSTTAPPISDEPSPPRSRESSRPGSRRTSLEHGSQTPPASSSSSEYHAHAQETHVHGSGASRTHHRLLHASMRPFTSLASGFGLGRGYHRSHGHHGSGSGAHAPNAHANHMHHAISVEPAIVAGSDASTPGSASEPDNGPEPGEEARAYTAIPDYEIASRGFLGGVPPLESMRGLPSYADSEALAHAPSRSTTPTANWTEGEP